MKSSFKDFIRTEREKREWTQTDFGAKIGINSSAISRIENGSQRFSTSKLIRLAEVFQMDIQEVKDLYYADKFAHEAFKNNCSDVVFTVAENAINYLKNKNTKQGELKF